MVDWTILYITLGIIILIFITVFIVAIKRKPVYCPKCNAKMPPIRLPENFNQALFGGWTCRKCGCEIDKNGKIIAKP